MNRLGRGYIPDSPADRARYKSHRALIGAGTSDATPVDHSASVLIYNQAASQSCTGHAFGGALETRSRILNVPKPPVSKVGVYTVGRWMASRGRVPLVDEGAWPRSVVDGMIEFGAPLDSDWPFDLSKINQTPDLAAFESADERRIGVEDAYIINGDRVKECRRMLSAGYPVAIAVYLNRAFEDHVGESVLGPPNSQSDVLGGHMIYLCGWREDAFKMVNSWGTSWGAGGFAWLGNDFVGSAYADSAIALKEAV